MLPDSTVTDVTITILLASAACISGSCPFSLWIGQCERLNPDIQVLYHPYVTINIIFFLFYLYIYLTGRAIIIAAIHN